MKLSSRGLWLGDRHGKTGPRQSASPQIARLRQSEIAAIAPAIAQNGAGVVQVWQVLPLDRCADSFLRENDVESPGMPATPAKDLPGYRRTLRVEAGEGAVVAQLEDDYHCMSVTLEHDGQRVKAVIPDMNRAPWTTCPGAPAKLVETFTGQLLTDVTARREKQQNCTHLHDLAVLAAAHAQPAGGLTYEIYASDPVEGQRILEIRRDGETAMRWVEQDGVLVSPEAVAGFTLTTLREWIASLPEEQREPARLLQWASIVAHGRTLPWERMHLTDNMPPSCYTFQPERIGDAVRNGKTIDFSATGTAPLGTYGSEEIQRVRRSVRRR